MLPIWSEREERTFGDYGDGEQLYTPCMISLSIMHMCTYTYVPARCMKCPFSPRLHQAAYEDCGVGDGPIEPRRFLVALHCHVLDAFGHV